MHTGMWWYTKENGFSKQLGCNVNSLANSMLNYNFILPHQTMRFTLVVYAGIASRPLV